MWKSTDQQYVKTGSPRKKHRRHAWLIAMDRKRQAEIRRKKAWRDAHRLDGMFDSVEEMMKYHRKNGNAQRG